MARLEFLELGDLRGGRNDYDSPRSVPENQLVEALNVDWSEGTLAHRRGGAAAISMTSSGLTGTPAGLFRHLPTADETAAEPWVIDSDGKVARHVSNAWSAITPTDAITASSARSPDLGWASLNGKMFVGYKSAKDRLHVWDGTTLRRVGLGAPTAAPTNSGTSAGVVSDSRMYKTAVTVQVAGVTTRRSELSAATAVITSAAQQRQMTLGGAPGDGETHWELYGASVSDNYATYYLLTTVAIASVQNDNFATVAGATGTVAYTTGTNTVPWSARYVLADENRLLFAGSFETAGYASRVGFSAISGSTDIGDEERWPYTTTQKNYLDLDRGDGGGITGMGGPLSSSPIIFKLGQIYKLVRTGINTAPYVPVTISKSVGCIRHQTICNGEDEDGNPCLYFLSREGPYRLGTRGLQYLGNDNRTAWASVNLAATTIVAHAVYHQDKKQYWYWVATGSSDTPDTRFIFDVRRGQPDVGGVRQGWAKHTGLSCQAWCSAMLPSLFATLEPLSLKPYIGQGSTGLIWRCDTTALNDNGTNFQSYVKTKPYALAKLGRNYGVVELHLLGKALAATTISVDVTRDFGLETRTFTVSLAPSGSETHVLRQFEDAQSAQAGVIQFQIGDAAAGAINQWTLDALAIRFTLEEADR